MNGFARLQVKIKVAFFSVSKEQPRFVLLGHAQKAHSVLQIQ